MTSAPPSTPSNPHTHPTLTEYSTNLLNSLFPDFNSLSQLSSIINDKKTALSQSESSLRDKIRNCSSFLDEGRSTLSSITTGYSSLQTRLQSLSNRTGSEDHSVEKTFEQVAQYDTAKRNLSLTISILRKISLLLSSLSNLDALSLKNYPFDETGPNAASAIELSKQLKPFQNTQLPTDQKLSNLIEKVNVHVEGILTSSLQFLSSFSITAPSSSNCSTLSSVTSCLDSLRCKNLASIFVHYFCNLLLNQTAVADSSWFSQLKTGSFEKRSEQLKQTFATFSIYSTCFPPSWSVSLTLGYLFAEHTRVFLDKALENLQRDASLMDGQLLMFLFKKCRKMEDDLANFINQEYQLENINEGEETEEQDFKNFSKNLTNQLKENKNFGSNISIENSARVLTSIKKKYKQLLAQQSSSINQNDRSPIVNPFFNQITSSLDTYLRIYVIDEQSKLRQITDRIFLDHEVNSPTNSEFSSHFSSCTVLFREIKAIIHRGTKLSNGQLLFDLFKMMKIELNKYAKKLPECLVNGELVKSESRDELNIIRVILTCDFCISTINLLQESLQEIIVPAFSSEIDFSETIEIVINSLQIACQTFVESVNFNISTCFNSLLKINWAGLNRVGDASPWVDSVYEVFSLRLITLRSILNSRIAINYLIDRLVSTFCNDLYNVIFRKIDQLSNFGTQQLLIDTLEIRQILANIPKIIGYHPSNSFSRILKSGIEKIEMLLKVILVPKKLIVRNFITLIGASSVNDFCRFLELKGIRHIEAQKYMEEYLGSIS
ncbi:hypothetical protein RCL1_002615 [Eukaryota sp. TZLM3-RCL]